MKKLSLVFAFILMFVLCVSVGASELDIFKEPMLNYTSVTETKVTLNSAEEFLGALEELKMLDEFDTMLPYEFQDAFDIRSFLTSICYGSGTAVVKADISEDYNKIKLSMESVSDFSADINANLNLSGTAKSGLWVDFDVSDVANPKCVIIKSDYSNKYYQYLDLFDLMSEEEKPMVLLMIKSVLNEKVIGDITSKILTAYENCAEITSDKETVTIKFDNAGFLKFVDETVDIVVDLLLNFATDDYEIESFNSIKEFPIADLGIQILGEKGFVMEYKKDGSEADVVCDFYIDLHQIFSKLWIEIPETENEFAISFTISETQKISGVGTTQVSFPALTEENSVNVYDEIGYDEEYYDDYEYEVEYPYYYASVNAEYIPSIEGKFYVPFRALLENAYDGNINITFDNGLITVTSEYFTDMEKVSFKVGEATANVDGSDFEVGEIVLHNGVTYVSSDFFETIFGWELSWASYDMLDGVYYFEFTTEPYEYDEEW